MKKILLGMIGILIYLNGTDVLGGFFPFNDKFIRIFVCSALILCCYLLQKTLKKTKIKNLKVRDCLFLGCGIFMIQSFIVHGLSFAFKQTQDIHTTWGLGYYFLICVLVAPTVEELLFRFLICGGLRDSTESDAIAIIVSSLFFAILHHTGLQIISATLTGLAFGYVYCKTLNINVCILLHMCNNFLSMVFIPFPVLCIIVFIFIPKLIQFYKKEKMRGVREELYHENTN